MAAPFTYTGPQRLTIPINNRRCRSLVHEEGEDHDRISEFPDEIICHILSCLPTIYAVRTTLLSKRWNKMWTFVRNLDFDIHRDLENFSHTSRFESFVEFVFLRLASSHIGKFRFRSSTWSYDFPYLRDWVSAAVWRNVVHVELDLRTSFGGVLPESMIWCKTLKVLKLWIEQNVELVIPDLPASVCFPSLKIFHVTVIDPPKNLGKLLSYFPVLEDLSIHLQVSYSYNYYHSISTVKIAAPELKTMKISVERAERHEYEIRRDHYYDDKALTQNQFCVDAPKLENLDVIQIPCSHYILENPNSVVNASMSFKSLAEEEWPSFPDRAYELLTGISNVKCLTLLDQPFNEASNLPVFGNLKQLKLVLSNCNSWEFLTALLEKTPNLEDLDLVLEYETRRNCNKDDIVFSIRNLFEDATDSLWTPPQLVPYCLCSTLKTISMRGFKGLQVEKRVANYMLLNGYHLNKMTIYPYMFEKEESWKDLLTFRRAVTCQVEFREMPF